MATVQCAATHVIDLRDGSATVDLMYLATYIALANQVHLHDRCSKLRS